MVSGVSTSVREAKQNLFGCGGSVALVFYASRDRITTTKTEENGLQKLSDICLLNSYLSPKLVLLSSGCGIVLDR